MKVRKPPGWGGLQQNSLAQPTIARVDSEGYLIELCPRCGGRLFDGERVGQYEDAATPGAGPTWHWDCLVDDCIERKGGPPIPVDDDEEWGRP